MESPELRKFCMKPSRTFVKMTHDLPLDEFVNNLLENYIALLQITYMEWKRRNTNSLSTDARPKAVPAFRVLARKQHDLMTRDGFPRLGEAWDARLYLPKRTRKRHWQRRSQEHQPETSFFLMTGRRHLLAAAVVTQQSCPAIFRRIRDGSFCRGSEFCGAPISFWSALGRSLSPLDAAQAVTTHAGNRRAN